MGRNDLKVLIVDDSAVQRRVIAGEIEDRGYIVESAKNGFEALEKFKTTKYDLITLDIEMPDLDGYEVCEKIREIEKVQKTEESDNFSYTPIVFLTAKDDMSGRIRGFDVGASDFFNKGKIQGGLGVHVDKILKSGQRLEGVTAVLIDDNSISLIATSQALEQEGIEVFGFLFPHDALEYIKTNGERVDIVITGFNLPELNGAEICEVIRQNYGFRDLPILVLTAVEDRARLIEVYSAGANDCVLTPFIKEELLSRLNVHIDSRAITRKLKENLREMEKLIHLRDEFLAVCAHDLRAPLNGILGFTEILLMEDLDENHEKMLRRIESQGTVLNTMISELLLAGEALLMNEGLELQELSAVDTLRSVAENSMGVAAEKNIEVKFSNQLKLDDKVYANKVAVSRVLNNLVSNSIKFTPESGEILLSVVVNREGYVDFIVKDTGVGIPEEMVPIIFDRFTKAGRKGTKGEISTGLGLSIVHQLVEKQNGEIEVSSVDGSGTTMTVSLPKVLKDAA